MCNREESTRRSAPDACIGKLSYRRGNCAAFKDFAVDVVACDVAAWYVADGTSTPLLFSDCCTGSPCELRMLGAI
jgi:hypothetical protein